MAKLPTLRAFMDTEVPTVPADMNILDAVNFLLTQKQTGVVVVTGDREIVGILSEKDCLKLLAVGDEDFGLPQGTVADYMTRDVKSVPAKMNIYFVAGMFLNDVIRRFPVVENGRLVGQVTRFDILRAIREHLTIP